MYPLTPTASPLEYISAKHSICFKVKNRGRGPPVFIYL